MERAAQSMSPFAPLMTTEPPTWLDTMYQHDPKYMYVYMKKRGEGGREEERMGREVGKDNTYSQHLLVRTWSKP